MPRRNVYVTAADAAFLDALPEGMTTSALLRDAIARARRAGQDCEHSRAEVICPDCAHNLGVPVSHLREADGS